MSQVYTKFSLPKGESLVLLCAYLMAQPSFKLVGCTFFTDVTKFGNMQLLWAKDQDQVATISLYHTGSGSLVSPEGTTFSANKIVAGLNRLAGRIPEDFVAESATATEE